MGPKVPTQITQQEAVGASSDFLKSQPGTGSGSFLKHLRTQGSPLYRAAMNNTHTLARLARPGRKPPTSSSESSSSALPWGSIGVLSGETVGI